MEKKKPGEIKKLDEVVINRIAAGEVIQRPANALKELIENSIDANASNIQVSVVDGGMKQLQIQDDGCGIRKEDLSIVCERFTTSKLEKFEDLQDISTYGFRGEALASISHVAHLKIITKTDNSICAYKAEYIDGKLKEYPGGNQNQNPKACAGKNGTTIIAEDLFFNMETRRKALKSFYEEYNRVHEVVTRYSIHNSKIGFSLRKNGENRVEYITSPKSEVVDNIKIAYGSQLAKELLPFSFDNTKAQFKASGYVSNAHYSTKKLIFILFINHRLVESLSLKKAIENIYSLYLPKGTHPFIYISLEINPRNIDVNVHPTKQQVQFLHEDLIISTISTNIETILKESNKSRTFVVQSLLPGAKAVNSNSKSYLKRDSQGNNLNNSKTDEDKTEESSTNANTTKYAKDMVRTDPKLQKIDRFFNLTQKPSTISTADENANLLSDKSAIITSDDKQSPLKNLSPSKIQNKESENEASNLSQLSSSLTQTQGTQKLRREIRLKSVQMLIQDIYQDCHNELLETIKNFTFVGCVNLSYSLIQYNTKLLLINNWKLTVELFYQKFVHEFGNFGLIEIKENITIKELAQMKFELSDEEGDKEEMAEKVQALLLTKAAMLKDYFSLNIDPTGRLLSLPLVIENYFPAMEYLPNYIVDLANNVNWESEKDCFSSFCYTSAIFYSIHPGDEDELEEITLNDQSYRWTIENVIFREAKCLIPPKQFAEDKTFLQIADLPDLYKVFERC